MACKNCDYWKSDDKKIGFCMHPFVGDCTPPENYKSKKKIKQWIDSNEWRDRTEADFWNCKYYTSNLHYCDEY